MSRRPLAIVACGLVAAALAAPVAGQQQLRYVAFGDSLTWGIGDLDPQPSGYPPRLEKLLRKAGESVVVVNQGVPGETSGEGLSRLPTVLAGSDCVLLLEGSNDIALIESGALSVESVVTNLDQMARLSMQRGVQPVHATIPPRNTTVGADRNNAISFALVLEIRNLAVSTGRRLVDIWEAFDIANDPDSFDTLYATIPRDPVGHPNPEGYDRIAGVFGDVLQGLDTVKPVPGGFWPSLDTSVVTKKTVFQAVVLEPKQASGIDLGDAFLMLNGRAVATPDPEFSNRRRAFFTYHDPEKLGCRAELGVRVADRNDPANVIDRTLRLFTVARRRVLVGDVDFDCRVSGFDLVAVARRVGAQVGDELYASRYDLARDGRIDEADIEALSANFGKVSK